MGDHVNGPSHVIIDESSSMQIGTNPKFAEFKQEDKSTLPVSELIKTEPDRFLG